MNVHSLISATTWHPGRCWQDNAPVDISVLLPTFCRAQSGLFIRAVRSVLVQCDVSLELIIVDDASVDGTAALVSALMQQDPRVSCLKHPVNIGLPAISEFEAYQKARGEFIAFAFDDDEFLPDALSQLLAAARTNKAKFVYGYVDIHLPDATTQQPAVLRNFGRGGSAQTMLHSHNFISNNAVLVHCDVLEDIGLYDPHIAIARLCDWDLWCRIAQSYELLAVDVAVGRIDGPMRGESLGNTYGVELWLANEWMHLPRNQALRPANFAQYDVLAAPSALSAESTQTIAAIKLVFQSKLWHPPAVTSIDTGTFGTFQGSIAVLVSSYDASITLCFDRLPVVVRARLRVLVYQQWQGTLPEELVGASAIIIARDLFGLESAIAQAKQLQIPHYYFIDDNLVALAGLSAFQVEYGAFEAEAVRAALQSFAGVLVSTAALQSYFLNEKLHHQVALLPPIELGRGAVGLGRQAATRQEHLKLAFIGGSHRADALARYVVPALVALAVTHTIELYLVGDREAPQLASVIVGLAAHVSRVRVVLKPFNYDLDSVLRELRLQEVSILLHPGEPHINGKFKTLNVLLNAKQIGAVPILSAVEPYLAIRDLGVAHVVENTEAAWLRALQACVASSQQCMLDKLDEFCTREFSGAASEAVMTKILEAHPPVTQVVRDARFRRAMAEQKAINRQINAQLLSRRFVVKRAIKMVWEAVLTKLRLR